VVFGVGAIELVQFGGLRADGRLRFSLLRLTRCFVSVVQ
jgi:hypothetical protein